MLFYNYQPAVDTQDSIQVNATVINQNNRFKFLSL